MNTYQLDFSKLSHFLNEANDPNSETAKKFSESTQKNKDLGESQALVSRLGKKLLSIEELSKLNLELDDLYRVERSIEDIEDIEQFFKRIVLAVKNAVCEEDIRGGVLF